MSRHTANELPPRGEGHHDCYGCRLGALFEEISRETPRFRPLLNNVFENWECASADADYYRCIFNGSWPDAIEILERKVEELKAKRLEATHA